MPERWTTHYKKWSLPILMVRSTLTVRLEFSELLVRNFQVEHPLKWDFRLGKLKEPHQPWPLKSNMAALCITAVMSSGSFFVFCVSCDQLHTQYCSSSVCGHVAMVSACAKYNEMCCYQAQKLFFLCKIVELECDVIPSSNLWYKLNAC